MSSADGNRSGLSFFAMVAGVMTALKLKERWDGYSQVQDEEEGRVALASAPAYRDEENGSLLDTQLPTRTGTRRAKSCCLCCGIDCSLFWKAVGIVVGLLALYGVVKSIAWAVTPSPTGLEDQPEWSQALGCLAAEHKYNGTDSVRVIVPVGDEAEHLFDIRGPAVGTITIAEGAADASDIEYDVALSSSDKSALEAIAWQYPTGGRSRFIITTPGGLGANHCMRFDVTVYVPTTLKRLHVASHSTAHIRFDAQNTADSLDHLSVTLYSTDNRNMIVPHAKLRPKKTSLELFTKGYIVGEVAISEKTSILTQRGAGIASLKIHPLPSMTEVAELETITGAGRTDIVYIDDHAHPHRTIKGTHMSSLGGDVYLTYRNARFSGRIQLASRSHTATGLQPLKKPDEENTDSWTHWVGDEAGLDTLLVKSKGWTGLYF